MIAAFNRTSSFFTQWLAEVVRQPWLMLSLVGGPFLVLLAFGQGVRLGVPKPRVLLVEPRPGEASRLLALGPEDLRRHMNIAGITTDPVDAMTRLTSGDVELVAVLPADPAEHVRAGRHATIRVYSSEIDPVVRNYSSAYLHDQIGEANRAAVGRGIGQAQSSLGELAGAVAEVRAALHELGAGKRSGPADAGARARFRSAMQRLAAGRSVAALSGLAILARGGPSPEAAIGRLQDLAERLDGDAAPPLTPQDLLAADQTLDTLDDTIHDLRRIPPDVLAAPFEIEGESIAQLEPNYISFYAPAVVALLIQHLAVTLGALSMARIRLLGMMELLQSAPARPSEVVTGTFISYGSLTAAAAAMLVALLVAGVGVPMLGSWLLLVATAGTLIVASLGLGFVISLLSSSEHQAAQLAMLVLIASVFFSGFVVSLSTIVWPFRAISYLLPATYAIRALQDLMLRGSLHHQADVLVLTAAAVALFGATVRLFRREYRPR